MGILFLRAGGLEVQECNSRQRAVDSFLSYGVVGWGLCFDNGILRYVIQQSCCSCELHDTPINYEENLPVITLHSLKRNIPLHLHCQEDSPLHEVFALIRHDILVPLGSLSRGNPKERLEKDIMVDFRSEDVVEAAGTFLTHLACLHHYPFLFFLSTFPFPPVSTWMVFEKHFVSHTCGFVVFCCIV
ncbi:unnamed protein product [Leuciscus chuanchicus]